jgi:hypothetical protein
MLSLVIVFNIGEDGNALSIARAGSGIGFDVRTHMSVFKDMPGVVGDSACNIELRRVAFDFAEDPMRTPLASLCVSEISGSELLCDLRKRDPLPDPNPEVVEVASATKQLSEWMKVGFEGLAAKKSHAPAAELPQKPCVRKLQP